MLAETLWQARDRLFVSGNKGLGVIICKGLEFLNDVVRLLVFFSRLKDIQISLIQEKQSLVNICI